MPCGSRYGVIWDGMEGISRGLKPYFVAGFDVQAEEGAEKVE
jgi:hypothetical protein